jgi:hypothetical protein
VAYRSTDYESHYAGLPSTGKQSIGTGALNASRETKSAGRIGARQPAIGGMVKPNHLERRGIISETDKTGPHSGADLRQAIATSLKILTDTLGDTVSLLTEAQAFIDNKELNAAIGTIIDLEARLGEAGALHRAILVLHRQR